MIFIVVKFAVRPEYSQSWLERVAAFTQATRDEPGNLWFEWSHSAADENEFVLLEAFRDADAGSQHVSSPHFRAAMELMPPLLASTPRIINTEVPGTDWSSLSEMSVPPA
jgi:quinol monooxygenase YgiN